jgi:hypothetical protein
VVAVARDLWRWGVVLVFAVSPLCLWRRLRRGAEEGRFRCGVWLAGVMQLRLHAWLVRCSSPVRLLLGRGSDELGLVVSSVV